MDLKIFLKIALFACVSIPALAESKVIFPSGLRLPAVQTKNATTNNPRIINGTEADWNGTRYQVSVRLKVREWLFGGGHLCGGTLISEDIVLTACHCIWNYETSTLREAGEFSVVVGNLNRFSKENSLVFNVTKISTLPTFLVASYVDDIAIVFLDGKVPTDFAFAAPIPINEVQEIPAETDCLISGWGRMETGAQASVLMVVDVKIIDRAACKEIYEKFLLDGMLCAGYLEGQRDACNGDSGGPLVCGEKLVGIISFGIDCAQPGYPGVYTNVSHYIEWIEKERGDRVSESATVSGSETGSGSGNESGSGSGAAALAGTSMLLIFLLQLV